VGFCSEPGAFRRFRYAEIKRATDDLSSVIGKGGFGTVYKARFGDGSAAAVKRMAHASRQRDNQFCREMEFLGRLHHRHLVTLRGFCITRTERYTI
jgi:serine/threonine protein kinase